jgi:outer membrane protein assembly factor BamB
MRSYPCFVLLILLCMSCNKENFFKPIASSTVNNASLVSTGLVFIAKRFGDDSATLFALDIKTGSVKWKFTSNKLFSRFSYTPCVAQNTLFVEVQQGSSQESTSLFAFNAHTGRLLWKTVLNHNGFTSLTNPTFENGNVYVAAEKKLFSINATTGSINWKQDYDSSTSDNELCSPTVQNSSIFIGNKKHFFALDTANGAIKWQVDADLRTSSPTVANGLVTFINSDDGKIKAYDFKGNLQWESNISDYLLGSTTASQNIIYQYAPNPANTINYFGLNVSNGSMAWTYKQTKDDDQNNRIYGDPFHIENTLYITLGDSLIAVNTKDQTTKKWSYYTGLPVCNSCFARSSVVAGHGLVFDMALDNNLYALSAKDGNFLWKFKANDQYYSYSPVILFNDGVAIHPTSSGMTQ